MLVECVPRPELKAPVLELIRKVSTEHAGGKFAIPLAEMLRLSGEPGKSDGRTLRGRGEVKFARTRRIAGRIRQQGKESRNSRRQGLTLIVRDASGTYVTTDLP